MARNYLAHEKLLPGYAETSTRRRPKEPITVVVGERETRVAKCVGSAIINGRVGWLAFKMPGCRKYYFQYRPW